MPTLDSTTRRALRARAHHLDPVVSIGQHGLTPAVLREIDVALTAHELIKIRVFGDDRAARATLLEAICAAADAAPVQHLGKLLVIWRPRPEAKKAAKKAAGAGRADARKRSRPGSGGAPRAPASDGRRAKPAPGRGRPQATPEAPAPAGSSRRRRGEAAPRHAPPAGVPRAALPRRRRARG